MLKRTLIIAGAMSVMLLSGCGILGRASVEEMESVIAERDFYAEEYLDEMERQSGFEEEIASLEEEKAALEEEKASLEEELASIQEDAAGSGMTVEDYYTQPHIKEALDIQIDSMKDSFSGTYSDLGYEVSGNTFTYWFRFANQIEDVETAAAQLEAGLTEDMLIDIVTNVEEECGVTGITCAYIYYNADGSILYQDSYTK